MASSHDFLLFSFVISLSAFAWAPRPSDGLSTFGFDLHHRFSDTVKRWAGFRADEWPDKGTFDYYTALADHDRILHGRHLSSRNDNQTLTFYDGNTTISTGSLHYALVSLGTPNVTFLVALDTGSDLFWVPCDCKQCGPTSFVDIEFNIYSPNRSSTSKRVPCSNKLCEAQSKCTGAGSNCPYTVAYMSANTSSSGILIEDVMYLTTEDSNHEAVDAQIVFGCGQVQSGLFLDGAAPNGLFGLGMGKTSVPSILSTAGLTADSFSMCFGQDGFGRIIFGDKGSLDQEETPFNPRDPIRFPLYNVSVTGLRVGTSLTNSNFSAIVDSGTSLTSLADPAYTHLSESFNSQVLDNRRSPDPKIPFEYCYYINPNENSTMIPNVSLTMKGGGQFSVFVPIAVVAQYVYCLAVVKSSDLNIIGQNFMTGHRIVFDREKSVLGWKKFDCYDVENSTTLPLNPRNSASAAVSPAAAVGPNSYTPEATKETGNDGQVSVLPIPPLVNQSSHLNSCFRHTPLMLFLLLLFVILW
ncbi:aspartyl protease family protein 1 isoform X1 [Magnolia sinica]|uniref:aspartyl protease family protein 1 isoform X1 n=1 Tax=Magnolia sinica TaxID=86752 RepID=UPI00265A09B9|nr:aspartyl protease family protein 1 isoform X1 [Magnolia sinica]